MNFVVGGGLVKRADKTIKNEQGGKYILYMVYKKRNTTYTQTHMCEKLFPLFIFLPPKIISGKSFSFML